MKITISAGMTYAIANHLSTLVDTAVGVCELCVAADRARLPKTAVLILVLMVLASLQLAHGVGISSPLASSARAVIRSVWAATPPKGDGKFEPGEYGDPQIIFSVPPYNNTYLNASVYFVNDASTLYVVVDAVGDETNDRWDENLLVFNYPDWVWIEFWGVGGKICRTSGGGCIIPADTIGVVGFDTSPNSAHKHKMYEVTVALKTLSATAGQSLDFCSPRKPSISYDDSTGRDNPWPDGLIFYKDTHGVFQTDINTWGTLSLAANPVPEFTTPAALITSVLVLACLVLVSSAPKKRKTAADNS